jgi:hypothetical protein
MKSMIFGIPVSNLCDTDTLMMINVEGMNIFSLTLRRSYSQSQNLMAQTLPQIFRFSALALTQKLLLWLWQQNA